MNRCLTCLKNCSPFLLAILLIMIFFSPELLRHRTFSFSDSGSFYYPLFKHIQDDYYSQGYFPLWEPNENLGMPLAASGTASIYYPGKFVFFLPSFLPISYETCYRLYILGHFLLCFTGMFLLIRQWRFSWPASLLAAISAVFGGFVLSLYFNLIFLVGAAWLPISVLCGDRLLRNRTLTSMMLYSASLAMMILGGEPQNVYFSGGILLALVFMYYRQNRLASRTKKSLESPWKRLLKSPAALLFYSACFSIILASIQFIPTMEFARHSERNWNMEPIGIWDIPGFLLRDKTDIPITLVRPEEVLATMNNTTIFDSLMCRTLHRGGLPGAIYERSLSPWRFLLLFNPRACGPPFLGSYWSTCLPGWSLHYDCSWYMTLYIGLIPVILILAALRFLPGKVAKRPSKPRFSPLPKRKSLQLLGSWGLLFLVLASLGAFAPGWFFRMAGCTSLEPGGTAFTDGDPVGGVYWLLNLFVPKFSSFRYPAKLMTPAIIPLAILIAIGWDCLRRKRIIYRIGLTLLLINLAVGLLLIFAGPDIFAPKVSAFFAAKLKYDVSHTWLAVTSGCFHAVITISLFLFVMNWSRRDKSIASFSKTRNTIDRTADSERRKSGAKPRKHTRPVVHSAKRIEPERKSFSLPVTSFRPKKRLRYLSYAVVILVFCDLLIANRGTIRTVPDSLFHEENELADFIKKDDNESLEPIRFFTYPWMPRQLSTAEKKYSYLDAAVDPFEEKSMRWKHFALQEKLIHRQHLANVDLPGTMTPKEYFFFGDWLMFTPVPNEPIQYLSFLGTKYFVYPEELVERQTSKRSFTVDPRLATLVVSGIPENPEEFVETPLPYGCSLLKSSTPTTRLRIYHNPPWRGNPRMSIFQLMNSGDFGDPQPNEFARFVKYTPNQIEMNVQLSAPASLLVAEQYFPGWKARLFANNEKTGKEIPIHQALGFLRSIDLPAGEHTVVMTYQPRSFVIGLFCSLAGWCCFLIVLGRSRYSKQNKTR